MVTWLILILLLVLILVTIDGIIGCFRLEYLGDVKTCDSPDNTLVSVIIAARNEERKIEKALSSILAQDYNRIEFILIDDRSTDSTCSILDRMADKDERIRAFHIKELEPGWLGKNHAMHFGAARAKGDYLLFTDADVYMEHDTVKRAVAKMRESGLDHLTLAFRPLVSSPLLLMLIIDSLAGLVTVLKPWKAKDPKSPYFFGVGAFNLVRSEIYKEIGGHKKIRLCPVDDILLGRLIKEKGGRQECLNGCDFVAVPWYDSVADMIRGLNKNLFAALDFRIDRLVMVTLLMFAFHILPFWGMFIFSGVNQILSFLILLVFISSQIVAIRVFGVSPVCLKWLLVTPYIKVYMLWYVVITNLVRGSIEWRGTFYSIGELKENMVPLWPWK